MRKEKNEGITLIALVITIIVLLILAGVTLSTLTGDSGILSNAEKAKEETKLANSREKVQLAVQGAMVEGLGIITYDNLVEELNSIIGETKYTITPEDETGPWTVTVEDTGYSATISSTGKTEQGEGGLGGTDEGELPVAEAGKRYEADEKIKVGNQIVSMPAGFTLSGATGEYESVDAGVVAYLIPEGTTVEWTNSTQVLNAQKTYDQFVWVPVPKEDVIVVDMNKDGNIDTTDIDEMIEVERFPMAIANGTNEDGSTKYRAVLYDFTLSSDRKKVEISDESYTEELDYWEPGYLKSSSYADGNATYNNVGITATSIQTEFDSMVAKVKENGGFWVGRYETSNMVKGTAENTATNDATNKVTVIKGTTAGIADITKTIDGTGLSWYRMYAQQKNYVNIYAERYDIETTRISSMIWGSQWDQIMIWMRKVANDKNTKTTNTFYVLNAVGMGNHGVNADETTKTTTAVAETGSSEDYKVKNIYDMSGNVADWTLESCETEERETRGSYWNTENFPQADRRLAIYPKYGYTYIGSRATIY